jgi:hypothetical protein
MSEDPWDMSDRDPTEDMKAAIKLLNAPTDYKKLAQLEDSVNWLTDHLTKLGKSPEEICNLYVKYGIWPSM